MCLTRTVLSEKQATPPRYHCFINGNSLARFFAFCEVLQKVEQFSHFEQLIVIWTLVVGKVHESHQKLKPIATHNLGTKLFFIKGISTLIQLDTWTFDHTHVQHNSQKLLCLCFICVFLSFQTRFLTNWSVYCDLLHFQISLFHN